MQPDPLRITSLLSVLWTGATLSPLFPNYKLLGMGQSLERVTPQQATLGSCCQPEPPDPARALQGEES